MKNKNLNIALLLVGAVLLVISVIGKKVYNLDLIVIAITSSIGAILIANTVLNLYMINKQQDKSFNIEMNDERKIMIREKTGYITLSIVNYIMIIIGLIFLYLDNYLVALLFMGIVILQPILLIIVTTYVEKKY